MKAVDLHTHTNKSDGSYSPSELVDYAVEKGLSAIAITDHDTVSGLDEAIHRAAELFSRGGHSVEVVPGIEFSTEYQKRDVHIVGLYIRHNDPAFLKQLKAFVHSRTERNHKLCHNLQEAGIDITYEKLLADNANSVITRAHYAAYLVKHGYSSSAQDAFSQYLGDHTRYFIPREKVTPIQAIQLILGVGGIPVLAHPTLYHMGNDRLDALVRELTDAGLMAIEGIYSTYTNQEERDMRYLADKYHLLLSGGSDFHGKNKPRLDLGTGYGQLFVPEELLDIIKEKRNAE